MNYSQLLESYVPVYDVVPEKWEDARPFLVEQLKLMATAINSREIGFYLDEELLTGKAFIPGQVDFNQVGASSVFRSVLRKVIDFGTLPNNSTKSVPHNILFDDNFTLINLSMACTSPTNLRAFGFSYYANTDPGTIILNMDQNNINVTTTSSYSTYERCYVVIEYMQEL